LTELQTLRLPAAALTDDGLQRLGHLTKLKELDLRKTNVTDAGLAHLAGMKRLTVLGAFFVFCGFALYWWALGMLWLLVLLLPGVCVLGLLTAL